MQKKSRFRWSVALSFVIFTSIGTSLSLASTARHLSETGKAVNEKIKSSWSNSKKITDKYTEITFGIGDDGKIYDPVVTTFTGDDQFDAECVEAICSMSPIVPPLKIRTGFLEHHTFRFGLRSDLKPAYDGRDVNNYRLAHPQPKVVSYALGDEPFVVVHRIPLTVLTRYPGLFTERELVASNNLIKVISPPIEEKSADYQPMYVRRIADLYAGWNEIFKQNVVTKAKILDWAKNMPPTL